MREPTCGAKGLTLTTTMSISPMPCSAKLLELVGHVAAGKDARVDRRVERLDLAAGERCLRRSGR